MGRNQKDFSYDNDLLLADGAAAVTAAGYTQVSGSTKTLDLGDARFDGRVILDIDAIVVNGAAPESYNVRIRFSNVSDFSSGVVLGTGLLLGAASATGASAANAAGERHEMPFTNEINGARYRYARLHVDVDGTAPSIDFVAFAVPAVH